MAGLLRRTMVYLGLVDDEYDDYEPYDEPQPVAPQPRQGAGGRAYAQEPEPGISSIRTIPREQPEYSSGVTVQPRPAVVRPIQPVQNAKPYLVHPTSFPEAQEIGDRLKASQPVIVNLSNADRELSRRMIDFCSGATYVLSGSMDKVAEGVFLLTPSNVEVSAEERRRLQERGYRS
ncbi:MAG: cell division inhibitor SepF [Acidimicrobiaceae bacterium]|jgi:cell division inhibitor SepF|nr:cell division inhibitor SepF [Acidimicrobiaceae bacterium]MDQ1446114.1 cell division inhibitor SepF [Acidimicrobiaceae bacterium]